MPASPAPCLGTPTVAPPLPPTTDPGPHHHTAHGQDPFSAPASMPEPQTWLHPAPAPCLHTPHARTQEPTLVGARNHQKNSFLPKAFQYLAPRGSQEGLSLYTLFPFPSSGAGDPAEGCFGPDRALALPAAGSLEPPVNSVPSGRGGAGPGRGWPLKGPRASLSPAALGAGGSGRAAAVRRGQPLSLRPEAAHRGRGAREDFYDLGGGGLSFLAGRPMPTPSD